MDKKNLYWEITTTANCRPEHPEDNTVILQANDMLHAIQIFQENRGYMNIGGVVKKCRQIFYFFDPLNHQEK